MSQWYYLPKGSTSPIFCATVVLPLGASQYPVAHNDRSASCLTLIEAYTVKPAMSLAAIPPFTLLQPDLTDLAGATSSPPPAYGPAFYRVGVQ
jgi:hypothetical protein